MSKCPQCNEVLKEGVKFCTKCGYEIAKEKVKKFFCPYCGYENIQGARICTWCEKEIATSNIIKEEEVNLFNGDGLADINFEDFERQAIDSLAEKHQFTYSVYAGEKVITHHKDCEEDVIIPKYFKRIANRAFFRDNTMKTLVIEEGVEVIEGDVFGYSAHLKMAQFPSTIKSIGLNAFDKVFLDTIIFNEKNPKNFKIVISGCCNKDIEKDIKDARMYESYNERGLYTDKMLEEIKSYSKIENESLIINFKKYREDIKKRAEANLEKHRLDMLLSAEFDIYCGELLKYKGNELDIVIHDSVTSIGASVFEKYIHCKKITSVKLPNKLVKIGKFAFQKAAKIKEIVFPETLEEIEEGAFSGCSKLENITFNYNLKKVGPRVFANCSKLKFVDLPSLTSIEEELFNNCNNLENINCPNVEVVSKNAFNNCNKLRHFDFENIKTIEEGAFSNCYNLEKIDIKNIKKINDYSYSGCSSVKEIILNEEVSVIGAHSFKSCSSLENIDLKNVKEIKSNAFSGCKKLKAINLSKLEKMGPNAFQDCASLKEVIIPEGIKEIEDYSFDGCNSLEKIILPNSLQKIGQRSFSRLTSLKYIIIPENVCEIHNNAFGEYKRLDYPSLKIIYIPKGKKFKSLPKGVKVKNYKLDAISKIKEKLDANK